MEPDRALDVLVPFGAVPERRAFAQAERTARLLLSRTLAAPEPPPEPEAWKSYFGTLLAELGIAGERLSEAGRALWEEHERDHMWTRIDPATPEALERLLEVGYRLGVVSNADGRMRAVLESTGLARHFEFVVDSHAVGVEKPDPRIFGLAVERLGLEASDCLYVGDLYAVDVVGARGAGLHPVLVDPFEGYVDGALDVDRISGVPELPAWLAGPHRSGG